MKSSVPRSNLLLNVAAFLYLLPRAGMALLILAVLALGAFMVVTQLALHGLK